MLPESCALLSNQPILQGKETEPKNQELLVYEEGNPPPFPQP